MVIFLAFSRLDVYNFAMDLRKELVRHKDTIYIFTELSTSQVFESLGNRFFSEDCEDSLFDIRRRIVVMPLRKRTKRQGEWSGRNTYVFDTRKMFRRFKYEPFRDKE